MTEFACALQLRRKLCGYGMLSRSPWLQPDILGFTEGVSSRGCSRAGCWGGCTQGQLEGILYLEGFEKGKKMLCGE